MSRFPQRGGDQPTGRSGDSQMRRFVPGTELTTRGPPNAVYMKICTANLISEKEKIPCLAQSLFSGILKPI
jgi:hypothetical protein